MPHFAPTPLSPATKGGSGTGNPTYQVYSVAAALTGSVDIWGQVKLVSVLRLASTYAGDMCLFHSAWKAGGSPAAYAIPMPRSAGKQSNFSAIPMARLAVRTILAITGRIFGDQAVRNAVLELWNEPELIRAVTMQL